MVTTPSSTTPTKLARSTKGKKYPAEPLTACEARLLIKACSRRAPTGVRNAALITLLYRGGLRITEALSLKPKDINLQEGSVRVLTDSPAGQPQEPVDT